MKLDLDRQGDGRSELVIDGVLDLGLSEGRATQAKVRGTLLVDNIQSRFVITGVLSVSGRAECGRCLTEFDLFWDASVEITILRRVDPDETEGQSLVLHQATGEVDLMGSLRECVILGYPQLSVCREDCKGLCAQCGADLNEGICNCTEVEVDPRWEGLP
ncbi:MAG: DUF177 domain-containing protein [Gemmatimonadales bacterium]|nr:DUF177 domain-containing protein [Gemmatimonadales bacterium]